MDVTERLVLVPDSYSGPVEPQSIAQSKIIVNAVRIIVAIVKREGCSVGSIVKKSLNANLCEIVSDKVK